MDFVGKHYIIIPHSFPKFIQCMGPQNWVQNCNEHCIIQGQLVYCAKEKVSATCVISSVVEKYRTGRVLNLFLKSPFQWGFLFFQNEKVIWEQDQVNTLDVHSLLFPLGQNSFTKCVTVVIYNPLKRKRRFFSRRIRYRQSLKLVMDLDGRYHCRVYRYRRHPHIIRDSLYVINAEIRTQYLSTYRSLYKPWMTGSVIMTI